MDRNLRRIFFSEIENQCEFALISKDDIQTYYARGDISRIWNSVHSLVSAVANLSKIFWPDSRGDQERGRELRQLLSVEDNSALKSRDLRNDLEHFDERLDTWASETQGRVFVDRNISSGNSIRIDSESMAFGVPNAMLRHLYVDELKVSFRNKEYALQPVVEEVSNLFKRVQKETSKPPWED